MRSNKNKRVRRDEGTKISDPVYLNPDTAVLKILHSSSADLSKNRTAWFYLYFPDEAVAEKAAVELKDQGFSVECAKSAGSVQWLCLAEKDIVPDISVLTEMRIMLENLALKFGGIYDGWETSLDADEYNGQFGPD